MGADKAVRSRSNEIHPAFEAALIQRDADTPATGNGQPATNEVEMMIRGLDVLMERSRFGELPGDVYEKWVIGNE